MPSVLRLGTFDEVTGLSFFIRDHVRSHHQSFINPDTLAVHVNGCAALHVLPSSDTVADKQFGRPVSSSTRYGRHDRTKMSQHTLSC